MPRFLNTFTGEFEEHEDPSKVVYAIISHTWERGGEQSYGDVRKLQSEIAESWKASHSATLNASLYVAGGSHSPFFAHPRLSPKLKGLCKVAREAGYRLLWFDACCIDKTNNAEVSTSLNSMYEWYRLANVCFVYLPGVFDSEDPQNSGSKFRESRWHTRGWTLQELIAPERVIFLTEDWKVLNTKVGLASTLEQITNVDLNVLIGRDKPDAVSVAKRMSWAAGRKTKFVEDRAYSLLGIFGVHIVPMYGEGTNAFLRLQEEIMKTIPDQSIFAWGRSYPLPPSDKRSDPRDEPVDSVATGLLAESPSDFWNVGTVTSLSPMAFEQLLGGAKAPLLHFLFTPQGVRADFLCIDLEKIPDIFNDFSFPGGQCENCMQLGRAHILALLRCRDAKGSLFALPLRRTDSGEGSLLVSTHVQCQDARHRPFHTIRLPEAVLTAALTRRCLPTSRTLTIFRHQATLPMSKLRAEGFASPKPAGIDLWPADRADGAVFRVAPWCEAALCNSGFKISIPECQRDRHRIAVKIHLDPCHSDLSTWRHEIPGSSTPPYSQSIHLSPISAALAASLHNSGPLAIRFSLTLDEQDEGRARASFDTEATHMFSLTAEANNTARSSPVMYDLLESATLAGSDTTSFDAGKTTEQVLASFSARVHVDRTGERFRVFRATLERPVDSSVERDRRTLWISVELSDQFQTGTNHSVSDAEPRATPASAT